MSADEGSACHGEKAYQIRTWDILSVGVYDSEQEAIDGGEGVVAAAIANGGLEILMLDENEYSPDRDSEDLQGSPNITCERLGEPILGKPTSDVKGILIGNGYKSDILITRKDLWCEVR